jgi:hypothetical protein
MDIETRHKIISVLVGSGISLVLAGGLSGSQFPWLIYPMFPGLVLIIVAIWFTDIHWGLHRVLAQVVVGVGNAAFYALVCYAVLRLGSRLRWKQ